ncbi:MAG TPA: TRAP transporter small permease subunit [Chroococcales cyanobacterium]|jgi:TRAP-type C4-dicarboxylate transport system permease small subunit
MEVATLEKKEEIAMGIPQEQPSERVFFWLKPLHHLDRYVKGLEACLIVVFMSAMLLLGTTQILLWNLFHQGLAWIDPLLRHLVLWTAMIGGTMATSADRHLNMDVLPRLLSSRVKKITDILVDLAAAGVVGVLAAVTVVFVRQEAASGGMAGFLNLARWQVQIILPVAFTVMSGRFLLSALDNLSSIFPPEGEAR